MIKPSLRIRPARPTGQSGFTLVELLVVIGIIAILAGVALGPITRGIKLAQQNAGIQTCHTLALAEFQYANDNNQTWPVGTGTDASDVAKALLSGGYISDPKIFLIGGSAESATPYTGVTTGPVSGISITKSSISYDFTAISTTQGLNSNVPDQLPVVFSSVGTAQTFPAAANTALTVTLTTGRPFGTAGVAVCYKSNSSSFLHADTTAAVPGTVKLVDSTFPGTAAISLVGGG